MLAHILEKIIISSEIRIIPFGQPDTGPTLHGQPHQQANHQRLLHHILLKVVGVTEDAIDYGDNQQVHCKNQQCNGHYQ